jgi:hypothetical protein
MGNDVRRHVNDRLAGERIFLAQPVSIGQRDEARDFVAQLVAIVNRRRCNRATAPLHRPPYV